MKKICYVVAMRAEARPLVAQYGLSEDKDFFAPLPCKLYRGRMGDGELLVVINGEQHGSDLIGCEAAAITTQVAIQMLSPDIVISSGTCGGWARHGTEVGKVYVGDGVMFHDRRVPGDNAWATQGLGNYPVWEGAAVMAQALSLPMGKVTTGSSFDMSQEEETLIEQYGGRLKEMEGAAVAFVCDLYKVPVLLVKVVANLRDGEQENMEAFQKNLVQASQNLLEANVRIIDYLLHQN